MTSKPTEKIIDALAELMEGYTELQEALKQEFGPGKDLDEDDDSDEEEEELNPEVEAALVTEVKAALENVIEGDDYTPEQVANFITTLTESLEEIDPTVFDHEVESTVAEDEVDDEDYEELDDDDIEYDDDDDDDLDDDEDEEDDEDE